MHRSAHAVPLPLSDGCCGHRGPSNVSPAIMRILQILLVTIALAMVIVNAFHVLSMFLAIVSNVMGAIMVQRAGDDPGGGGSLPASASSSGGGRTMEQTGGGGSRGSGGGAPDAMDMHHGVREILLEHTLRLREHMEKNSGNKKKDNEQSPMSSLTGGEAKNKADAKNRHIAVTAMAGQVVPLVPKIPDPTTKLNVNIGRSGSKGHSQPDSNSLIKLAAYITPPPPPRKGTVIWHCHMCGDPNPKGGGVMKQMCLFLGAYIVAQEKHAYLYRGNLSFEYTDNTEGGCNAPLESFVDIDSLPDLRAMLVDTPVGENFDPRCEPADSSWGWSWTHYRTVTFKHARIQFKASQRLSSLVLGNLCPPDSCVCLHSRLEEDFVHVFGQRDAGSGNSIANAIKTHMQSGGFGNATVLYVAGEQQDEYISIPQFINFTSKPSYGLRQFENAMIDLQACQNALYHVGTSMSIFDQWISEDRLLNHPTRSWDYQGHKGLKEFPLVANHGFTMDDVA